MKICLISRKFDKNSGSAEWIYSDFIRTELLKKGFEVRILEQKKSGIKSNKMKKLFYDLFILPIKLIKIRLSEGIKIYLFMSENQAIYSGLLRVLGSRTIAICYDLMRIKNVKKSFDWIYFYFIYWLLKFNHKLIVISSSTKQDLLNQFKIKENKISTIYPVYRNLKKINTKKEKKKIIIGYLGALGGIKRTDFFKNLEKEIIKEKKPLYEIHVWGSGDKGKLKESKFTKLKGFVEEKDVEKVYNSFDFFVFPCKYTGLGLPPIEAMNCGKPCFVLSDIDMPKEVKNLCIVCEDAEDIFKKIKDLRMENKYSQESIKILKRIEIFNVEKNILKLQNLILNEAKQILKK